MSKKTPPEAALYVRLPATAVDKLDRAAEALGVHKKDLVAGLVTRYVDPDSRRGLSALGQLSQPRRVTIDLGEPGQHMLAVGGEYAYRVRGEEHAWTAETVGTLQHAVRGNSYERYRAFAKIVSQCGEAHDCIIEHICALQDMLVR